YFAGARDRLVDRGHAKTAWCVDPCGRQGRRISMNGRCPVVVAAGGTGGHLFPAAALSHALAMRGFEVHLFTDKRAAKFGGDFPAHVIHNVAAATPSSGAFF